MADERTIHWEGKSGTKYKYWIYKIGTTFTAAPGNYVFAKETKPGTFEPIYIGETGDPSERFDNHHKMPCIRKYGATHIHVHTNAGGEAARKTEEADLVQKQNPPCND